MALMQFISSLGGLKWNTYLNDIVVPSVTPADGDTMQVFAGDVVLHEGTLYLYYTGNNASGDIDKIFCATKTGVENIASGWAKVMDGGNTKVILNVGAGGQWDAFEVYVRSVFYDVDHFKMYYAGKKPLPAYAIGLATSTDGIAWTKQGKVFEYTNPDVNWTVTAAVVKAGTNDYRAIFSTVESIELKHKYATSSDGITWAIQTDGGILASIRNVTNIKKYGNTYYICGMNVNSGIYGIDSRYQIITTTTDFTTFTTPITLAERLQPSERGFIGSTFLFNANKTYHFYSYYRNHLKYNNEPYTAIRVSELAFSYPKEVGEKKIYPDFVKRYYPLYHEAEGTTFTELINKTTTTKSSPSWDALKFLSLTGASISFTSSGLPSTSDFALKMRIIIDTSGTKTIFSIGTDIVVELVSGKLRVGLNNNTKQYITNAIIAIPSGITDYLGTAVHVGFIFQSSVLKLCVGNTVDIASTKTIDGAMSDINDSGNDVIIGNSQVRSVTISEGITATQWINLAL